MHPKKHVFILFACMIGFTVSAQNKNGIISGPWAGNVEHRNATIWVEVSPKVKAVAVKYYPEGSIKTAQTVSYKGELQNEFNAVKVELNGLQMNTVYNYNVILDGKPLAMDKKLQFTTKDLWLYRKPAPDFSFLAGSCHYVNEPEVDRPGKPYGGDSSIFEIMAKEKAALHLWMGDNWYTREVDQTTVWGLNYRASHAMRSASLQKFMSSMPQLAIWDDHDYGPNDGNKSYLLKEEARKVFMNYWCNPSYGQDGEGVYSLATYSDVDFFLTDDRYFRSHEDIDDSVGGKPNPGKTFFGAKQIEWLKNSLLSSKAIFKLIVVGSQVLNPRNEYECLMQYTAEYNEILDFIAKEKIRGVLFFTGDRHHSEVIKMERTGLYSLYDVTVSPYSAGVSKVRGNEMDNPARVKGTLIEEQNYGRISVSGPKGDRKMKVEFVGIKGDKLGEWNVSEKELK